MCDEDIGDCGRAAPLLAFLQRRDSLSALVSHESDFVDPIRAGVR